MCSQIPGRPKTALTGLPADFELFPHVIIWCNVLITFSKIRDPRQLLEASRRHSIHLEQNAPRPPPPASSTAFSLKKGGWGKREAGVRGRGGETTTELFTCGRMARLWGRQQIEIKAVPGSLQDVPANVDTAKW